MIESCWTADGRFVNIYLYGESIIASGLLISPLSQSVGLDGQPVTLTMSAETLSRLVDSLTHSTKVSNQGEENVQNTKR